MSNTIVIYHHPCSDGIAAAWVVQQALGLPDSSLHPAKYGEQPPDVEGKEVILVDFSYKRPVLLELLNKCKSMSIYDHHISAKEDLDGLEHSNLKEVVFDMKRSGAGIVWDIYNPDKPRPKYIDHVEDYDLWRFKLHGTKQIMNIMKMLPFTTIGVDEAVAVVENSPGLMVELGHGVDNYNKQMIENLHLYAKEIILDGHKVWAIETANPVSSEFTGSLIKDRAFGVTYWKDGSKYKFSLRSQDDREDVRKIAEKFGGGGHRNAAGFTIEKLPWD